MFCETAPYTQRKMIYTPTPNEQYHPTLSRTNVYKLSNNMQDGPAKKGEFRQTGFI